MTETCKLHDIRTRTGWFNKYAPHDRPGIDIGCGPDPIHPEWRQWDTSLGHGDATFLKGIPDETFWTVYSSHLLEHLERPTEALQNWYRVLRPSGYLIVDVPHRDLYERRTRLPSDWNKDHKCFYLPYIDEPPDTRGLSHMIYQAIPAAQIESLEVQNEGWYEVPKDVHSPGCYSIEAIILKPA